MPIEDRFYAKFYVVQSWKEKGVGCGDEVTGHYRAHHLALGELTSITGI